ncbi:hypothetical protein FBALC1_11027 [Flavobacteriales bacterium ALC-1]|nr:hypothetical protein FBALC1_11027 [Flavobacteriales bacterium ALC-1]
MKAIKYIISIALLVTAGFFFYKDFIEYSFLLIDTKGVILERTLTSGLPIIFPLVLGVFPLFYFLVKRTTKILFLYKGLIVCGILIGLGILFWRLRIYGLNIEFNKLSEYQLSEDLRPSVDVSYLKFEIYVLMGFIVGTLASILIFRDKNKPLLN